MKHYYDSYAGVKSVPYIGVVGRGSPGVRTPVPALYGLVLLGEVSR